jgi:uncharacterized SAM-dependent methyltransferase
MALRSISGMRPLWSISVVGKKSLSRLLGERGLLLTRELRISDVRKSDILLSKLDAQNKSVTFYAVDISKVSLEDNMAKLAQKAFKNVECYGLWGTLDDAYEWLSTMVLADPDANSVDPCPRFFCSFGSQFGNGYPSLEVARFQKWSRLLREEDRLLVGMDGTSDQTRLWNSYHDSEGLFERYIRNAFAHSNRQLGGDWFKNEEWAVDGEILQQPTMHRFVLTSLKDVHFDYKVERKEGQPRQVSLAFPKGSQIHCYEAFKYGSVEMGHFFKYVKYDTVDTWKAPNAEYCKLHLNKTIKQTLMRFITDQYLIKHADTKTDTNS